MGKSHRHLANVLDVGGAFIVEKKMLIEKLDIIEEKIERPIWWVSSTLLVGITLLAFVAVVMRYFFSEAYFWLDETCRYGFISVVVLWSGPIMQDDGHIKFDLFVAKLRGKAKYIHQFIVDVFISIICFLIAYHYNYMNK